MELLFPLKHVTTHDCYGRSWRRDILFALRLSPKVHICINRIIMIIIIDTNRLIVLFPELFYAFRERDEYGRRLPL